MSRLVNLQGSLPTLVSRLVTWLGVRLVNHKLAVVILEIVFKNLESRILEISLLFRFMCATLQSFLSSMLNTANTWLKDNLVYSRLREVKEKRLVNSLGQSVDKLQMEIVS